MKGERSMSKRRRGARSDTRPPQVEERTFAAAGDAAAAAPFVDADATAGRGAGQMLRAMRENAGIDAALVASALKVTPQKIDALEAERYEDLPDLTFARGLAAAFCRAFGADPAPVLACMPQAAPGLHAAGNANQPMLGGFEAGGAAQLPPLPRPLLWAVLALLLAALVIWLLPVRPESQPQAPEEPEPLPAPVIVEPEHTVQPPPALPASEPASAAEAASAAAPASAASVADSTLFVIEAQEAVWVEVVDAAARKRISRTLAKGERASVTDAPLPLRVAIGRRDAASVSVRGEPFDLRQAGGGGVTRFQVE